MALFGTAQRLGMSPGFFGGYEEPERKRGFWAGGDKFGGKDALAGVLAVLGDAFANQAGMQGGAVQNLSGGRLSAIDQAKEQARQTAVMRQLVASGMSPQDAMILSGDKTAVREQIGRKYEPQKPPAMQQNYEWWKGLPSQEREQFSQYQDVVNPKTVMGPDGRPYPVQRQVPGGLPPGYDSGEWEVVPEPQTSQQNGVFTQEMYRGLVSSLGQQQADDWMRRNGIRIGR